MSEPYKKVSNDFIDNAITDSNLTTLKVIWYIAANIKDHDFTKKLDTHTFNEKDLADSIDIKIPSIRKNIINMQKTTIDFTDEEGQFNKHTPLLGEIKVNYNGKIDIDIYSSIARLICDVETEYTFMTIPELYKLKDKHSMRLLPKLNTIMGHTFPAPKHKIFTLEKLNNLFGTGYKRFSTIAQEILKKTKKVLDESSTLSFNYEVIKENKKGNGRPMITGIKIIPIPNKVSETIIEEVKPSREIDYKSLELNVLYGISQTQDQNLEEEFDIYLQQQVEVFTKYCEENNKNYQNMTLSFARHIKGARDNKLDFFSERKG